MYRVFLCNFNDNYDKSLCPIMYHRQHYCGWEPYPKWCARILDIDDWARAKNIEAKAMLTTAPLATAERMLDYHFAWYEFTNDDDAVECILRFGEGREYVWDMDYARHDFEREKWKGIRRV